MAMSAAIRALSSAMAAASRRLSTASSASKAAALTAEQNTRWPLTWKLFRRLFELGGNRLGSVEETMNEWMTVNEGKVLEKWEVIKFVRDLRKRKRHKQALDLINWMEKGGMKFSFSNHAIRLDLISKVDGIDAAESYFSGLSEMDKNQQTYGTLLNIYCQEKMLDKVIVLYEKMKEMNFASNTLVLNNIMTLYMKLDEYKKVPELYQEMKENNIMPDNFTFSILITSYSMLKDNDSVERVFQEIKQGGHKLDWSVYSNLANHYVSIGLFEKAEVCLKMLEELMDNHDREPYHYLISLYTATKNISEVKRVWDSFKASFNRTTNPSYLVMLQALNKLGDFDALRQCFAEWDSRCAAYDIRLANIMLGAFLQKDMLDEAKAIMKKASRKGQLSFRTFELFISYYLEKGKLELALQYLQDSAAYLKDWRLKPGNEMIDNFLKYFEESKNITGFEAFCATLQQLGFSNNLEAYKSLLKLTV